MQIYPIRNSQDHAKALARIEKLMEMELTPAQGHELDALVTLVAAYEEKHHKIDAPTPIAAIEFWMDQRGLTRKDLEPILGSRARVSEVLNGKRTLTLEMIRNLHAHLGIPVELLIGTPTRTTSKKKGLPRQTYSSQKRPARRNKRPGILSNEVMKSVRQSAA